MPRDDLILFRALGSVIQVMSRAIRLKGAHSSEKFQYANMLRKLDYNAAWLHLARNACDPPPAFREQNPAYAAMLSRPAALTSAKVKTYMGIYAKLFEDLPESASFGQSYDEEVAARHRAEEQSLGCS
jgi:hypothetical protein